MEDDSDQTQLPNGVVDTANDGSGQALAQKNPDFGTFAQFILRYFLVFQGVNVDRDIRGIDPNEKAKRVAAQMVSNPFLAWESPGDDMVRRKQSAGDHSKSVKNLLDDIPESGRKRLEE